MPILLYKRQPLKRKSKANKPTKLIIGERWRTLTWNLIIILISVTGYTDDAELVVHYLIPLCFFANIGRRTVLGIFTDRIPSIDYRFIYFFGWQRL